jgi:hypothetical protein
LRGRGTSVVCRADSRTRTPADSLFFQRAGNVYWHDVRVEVASPLDACTAATTPGGDGEQQAYFGWKTSIDHWNDDAVWGLMFDGEDGQTYIEWQELKGPYTCESLDLAPVLTGSPDTRIPEPGMLAVPVSGF